jgi:hypothetical protein
MANWWDDGVFREPRDSQSGLGYSGWVHAIERGAEVVPEQVRRREKGDRARSVGVPVVDAVELFAFRLAKQPRHDRKSADEYGDRRP